MTTAHNCSLTPICPLKHAIGEVHERLRGVLRNVTLAELFKPCHPAEAVPTPLGLMVPAAVKSPVFSPA